MSQRVSQVSAPAPSAATPSPAVAAQQWQVLLAPAGDLSGDGQLRELISERRERQGGTGAIWYLPPPLVAELGLGEGLEAWSPPRRRCSPGCSCALGGGSQGQRARPV